MERRPSAGVLVVRTSGGELDPQLAALADAYGVTVHFGDWQGRPVTAGADAVRGVLAALGVDASTPSRVAEALAARHAERRERLLPRVLVVRDGESCLVPLRAARAEGFDAVVRTESGEEIPAPIRRSGDVGPGDVGPLDAAVEIPVELPIGYHHLLVSGKAGEHTCLLLRVPHRLPRLTRPVPGMLCQLYATCSTGSWGIGDAADLRELARWAGEEVGAGFLLINPVHASAPVAPLQPSPYFPTSRRFASPLYIRPEEIPEFSLACRDRDAEGWTDDNRIDRLIDRDRIWAAKRAVLHAVYAEFVRSSGERRAAFDAFVTQQGTGLRDFATWCALAEHYGTNWREWPAEFRHPRSAAVTEFRAAHLREVEFHAWLQWVVADQFREAHRVARDVGMPIGVLHDLAVGVDPDGADAWADADVLARGVTLGAPADMYNQQGQRWNLAAWHPDRLAERDFLPLRETIRPWLEIGGGLRIDHVLGFFRQWWVVDGAAAADGAYLRLDPEALLGVVLIEAARSESLVIGEDLGVVPPGVREFLSQRGILGTSILWFERSPAGAPLPASEWRRDCLATVTTHDLPPTFGYLTGVHVDLRARLGLLQRDAAEERAHDEADRLAWLAALADAGLLDSAVVAAVAADDGRPWSERIEPYLPAVTSALHAYLGRTPALLRGVYLPDVVGDRRPVNQPGTSDQYPNWCIRMSDADGSVVLVEDLREQFTERARELTRLIAGGPESASVRASTTSPTDISVDISDRAGSGEGRA